MPFAGLSITQCCSGDEELHGRTSVVAAVRTLPARTTVRHPAGTELVDTTSCSIVLPSTLRLGPALTNFQMEPISVPVGGLPQGSRQTGPCWSTGTPVSVAIPAGPAQHTRAAKASRMMAPGLWEAEDG